MIALASLLILAIVSAVILQTRAHLRQQIRNHMASRDAESLLAVMQSQRLADRALPDELLVPLADPETQFELMLKTSRIRGVIAARLYDTNGQFQAASPAQLPPATLASSSLARCAQLKPSALFLPQAQLHDLFPPASSSSLSQPAPLLLVTLPIHEPDSSHCLGIAEFWIDASSLAAEYTQMDESLAFQGAITLATATIPIVLILLLAFGKLTQSNRQLAAQTHALLRANHQLAVTSKTTALGAIAAHLIHGIKNPLSGIRNLIQNRPHSSLTSDEWTDLQSATYRIQSSVNEVVRVIQEQHAHDLYELSCEEIVQTLLPTITPTAQRLNVRFESQVNTTQVLPNHQANIVILILQNLITNALQATPKLGTVSLLAHNSHSKLIFEVHDQGPGFHPNQIHRLFEPSHSEKPDGNGIGLTITKQLANSLGADLSLVSSTPSGSRFQLALNQTQP